MSHLTSPAPGQRDPTDRVPMDGTALWALLIGIDRYEAIRPLRGAVNDVESMRIALLGQYAVPPERICVLTDERATRQAILSKFQRFLIENPHINYGDQILIQFCGHGSRMPDPTGSASNQHCESLVPYDGRTNGVHDIPDRTIAALLDQLANAKGNNITLVLDCCHAGSMSRGLDDSERFDVPGLSRVRGVDEDTRVLPADLDADILNGSSGTQRSGSIHPTQAAGATRGAMAQGWFLSPAHVLLGACRDREVASERFAPGVALGDSWYGAFSYALIEALGHATSETTYAQLRERIITLVRMEYPYQTPQCEGDRFREIFSGVRRMHTPLITVTRNIDDEMTLDAGYVHGLRKGTELAVFGPGSHAQTDTSGTPLAALRVESVGATTAIARTLQGLPVVVPERAKCVVTRYAYDGLRQRLHLGVDPSVAQDAMSAQIAHAALERLVEILQGQAPDGRPSPYLDVVADPNHGADVYVIADREHLRIVGPSGDELTRPIDLASNQSPSGLQASQAPFIAALHALENIARYRTVLALTNPDTTSSLADKFEIGLRRYVPGASGHDLVAVGRDANGALSVDLDPDEDGNNVYAVELRNRSARDVFAHIFMLSPDYSIVRLYPCLGEEEALSPGGTAFIGLRNAQERLLLYLPDGWDVSRDYLKVICTTESADLRLIEQGGVRVPVPARSQTRAEFARSAELTHRNALAGLLHGVVDAAGTRYMRSSSSTVSDDWTTVTTTIVTRRMAAQKSDLSTGERTKMVLEEE